MKTLGLGRDNVNIRLRALDFYKVIIDKSKARIKFSLSIEDKMASRITNQIITAFAIVYYCDSTKRWYYFEFVFLTF